MSGATWAIVPVKALGEAKQRLADVLPLAARQPADAGDAAATCWPRSSRWRSWDRS